MRKNFTCYTYLPLFYSMKNLRFYYLSRNLQIMSKDEKSIIYLLFLLETFTSHGIYRDLRTHSWGYAPEMAMLALDRARTRRANTFPIPLFGVRLTRAISFRQLDNSIANSSIPLAPLQFLIYERNKNRGCCRILNRIYAKSIEWSKW